MDKLIRNQIYYQKNKEKLKAKRRTKYRTEKKQQAKKIQKSTRREKIKVERKLKKWKLKLHLCQEAYKYCFWASPSWKAIQGQEIVQIQEKIKELEEKLSKLNLKSLKGIKN